MSGAGDDRPARFLWLPPGGRPQVVLTRRQELVFLIVGMTILFSGYDFNVFGLALPRIQHDLHIPEDEAGLTVSLFRIATLAALFIAPLADLFGRRRLLLITVFGEAFFTLVTAFSQNYTQFVWAQILVRAFGYSEEVLCFVVIAEEIDERARGWSIGMLGALNATGAGVASLAFALVNVLPFGWRALYLIGGGALFILAIFRGRLRETKRFELRRQELAELGSKSHAGWETLVRLVREYPGRLAAMLGAVCAFGFAIGPAAVLQAKYLQEQFHYRPWQVTLLYVFGGFVSVAGNVATGRLSDRLGRKTVMFGCVMVATAGFAAFYAGIGGPALPALWVLAIFGYLSTDALMAGCPAEIFPTAYRATAATLRYVLSTVAGAVSLALEGIFYDWFGAHGPAIILPFIAIPLALIAILFLPETAGRTLEQIADQPGVRV